MIRCPKCGHSGDDVTLHEFWEGDVMEFEQNSDGSISAEGVLLQHSDPVRVRGFCLSCQHRWTLRGIRQISQLRKAS